MVCTCHILTAIFYPISEEFISLNSDSDSLAWALAVFMELMNSSRLKLSSGFPKNLLVLIVNSLYMSDVLPNELLIAGVGEKWAGGLNACFCRWPFSCFWINLVPSLAAFLSCFLPPGLHWLVRIHWSCHIFHACLNSCLRKLNFFFANRNWSFNMLSNILPSWFVVSCHSFLVSHTQNQLSSDYRHSPLVQENPDLWEKAYCGGYLHFCLNPCFGCDVLRHSVSPCYL